MDIEELVPYVAVELPGCPEFVIERAYREELYNLYRDNALWLFTDPAAGVDTAGVVTFTLPSCTDVHEIRSMRIERDEIEPRGPQSVNDYDMETETGTPLYVQMRNDAWIVRPKPNEATTAHCVLQIGPQIIADCVDDNLAKRHRLMWEHMVLTRLQAQAGQSWTNLKGAAFHAGEFTRLLYAEKRRLDGWTARRVPVVAYGGY